MQYKHGKAESSAYKPNLFRHNWQLDLAGVRAL